jgi:hypothetical protein
LGKKKKTSMTPTFKNSGTWWRGQT